MRLCPACGWPQEEESLIAPSAEALCKVCKWSGQRKDLLAVASSDLSKLPQIVKRLEVLYQDLMTVHRPLGTAIVRLGLIPSEAEYAPLLAAVLERATRDAFAGIVSELFPKEEANVSDEAESGRGLRPATEEDRG